jgi:hypothetical protein
VPGDVIKLTRRYYDHKWYLGLFNMLLSDPDLPPLTIKQTEEAIDSIELDSLTYEAADQGLWVFGTAL